MKLYATITGGKLINDKVELVSKSQGSNHFLSIPVQVEQVDGVNVLLCKIDVNLVINRDYPGQRDYIATILHNFERKEVARIPEEDTKGNKQKGEEGVCIHNVRTWNCPECNPPRK